MSKALCLLLVISVVLSLLISTVNAEPKRGWLTYKGAWFTIQYPPAFSVRPSLKSSTAAKGLDSAFFVSPGRAAEFYVFSPQWNGDPKDIVLNPATEESVVRKEEYKNGKRILRVTIGAKDKSYVRSYVEIEDKKLNTRLVFGIRYREQRAYDKYKADYLKFMRSLRQYAD